MIQYDFPKWKAHFITVEGNIAHMYLDGKGVVTIGIGCVIYDTRLSMLRKVDNSLSNFNEVESEYVVIKSLQPAQSMLFYDNKCKLYMTQAEIDKLFTNRLNTKIQEVESGIAHLDSYPELASLVIVDMAFNVGIHGLQVNFPLFTAAFKNKDWITCEKECEREGIQQSRNDWAKASFKSLQQGVH